MSEDDNFCPADGLAGEACVSLGSSSSGEMYNGIEAIRDDMDHILAHNATDINHYMDHYNKGSGSQYHLNNTDDVEDMLAAVHSSALWDDLFDTALSNHHSKEEAKRQHTVEINQNKPYVEAGLEAIAECGEAMEALAESLEHPGDLLRSEILQSMAELALEDEAMNDHFNATNDFIQSDTFWNEVVQMEVEAKEHVPTNISTKGTIPTVKQDDEVKDSVFAGELMEVVASTGDSIAALASDTADFIEEYKKTAQLEIAAPTVEGVVAIDQEMISPIKDMLPKDSFWSEVINMHQESLVDDVHTKSSTEVVEDVTVTATAAESRCSPVSIEDAAVESVEETSSIASVVAEEGSERDVDKDSPSDSSPSSPSSSHSGVDKDNMDNDERYSPTKPSKTTKKPTESHEEPRSATDSAITTSTVWEDIAVASLRPHQQILIDKATISVDPVLQSLATEIESRALKGPNLIFSFTIMMIAFGSIALIASSHTVKESPYLFRILWALAFIINLISVSMPGRLDRVLVDGNHVKPWSSLFEASPWAFAIWGVIYVSEFILSGYVTIIGIPIKLFQHIVAFWLAGNWFQGLWCFSFRPEFKTALWVPSAFLALGTAAFSIAHYEISSFIRQNYPVMSLAKGGVMLFRIPFAMHATWLAAATLINFNSYIAVSRHSKGMQIAVALLSAVAAFAFGLYGALSSGDPIISMTAAWALEACSTRTYDKLKQPHNNVSADVHESLAITESICSNILKCVSLGIIVAPFVAHV